MKELLRRHQETLVTYIGLALAALIAAWLLATVVRHVFTPTIDANARAYVYLVQAVTCGRYSEAQHYADTAYSMSDDEDIRKMSDYVSRMSRMALKTGVTTRQEADSFTGLAKGFVTGFMNPLAGLEGLGMTIESMFGNFQAIGDRLDARYKPVFVRYRRAQSFGTFTFWTVLVAATAVYFRYRRVVEPWIRQRVRGLLLSHAPVPTQAP